MIDETKSNDTWNRLLDDILDGKPFHVVDSRELRRALEQRSWDRLREAFARIRENCK